MNAVVPADCREIRVGEPGLAAFLGIPAGAEGIVIFAHGSGSGRMSPRNNYVARRLREAGFATLLLDLLSPAEEQDRANVFDIGLLAARLRSAVDWCAAYPATSKLRAGFFGASTGAGAALRASVDDRRICAVVSRGGRPDLAGVSDLAQVRAPTLLIVGSLDGVVIDLNRAARDAMRCERQLVIVQGAGHLFEEAGTLDEVVELATGWFRQYLRAARP